MYQIGQHKGLQDAFPDAKFIFPTASKRRAVALCRTGMNQWFDLRDIKEQEREEEYQFEGLRESSQYVHRLLETEIEAVGAENVVLWGLSQGAATTMISLLLWRGVRFAAAIGMCGWVPLKARMEREIQSEKNMDGEADQFDGGKQSENSAAVDQRPTSKLQKAVQYLNEELELGQAVGEASNTPLDIPVFVGHGTLDPKVPMKLGEEANEILRLLEFDVELRLYERLGHWYSSEMLQDIVSFLQQKTNVEPAAISGEQSGVQGQLRYTGIWKSLGEKAAAEQ